MTMPLRRWLFWLLLASCAGAALSGSGTRSSLARADDAPQAAPDTRQPDAQAPDARAADTQPPGAQADGAQKPDSRKADSQKFIRLERTAAGLPISLQTAMMELKATRPAEAGLTVTLVGAVHIAEKPYYDALNDALKTFDVVLYEMVARPGHAVPKGPQRGDHPVLILQNAFRDAMRLEHQLENIDYDRPNFVHADMSPEDFARSMRDRKESVWDMLARSAGRSLSKPSNWTRMGNGDEISLLLALVDKRHATGAKRALAEQFENLDDLAQVIDGPRGSTILSERNKVALEELKRQIAAGKKRIAIFYGVAHMPDIERRLIAEFAMRSSGERWLTAWSMPESQAGGAAKATKVKKRRARKIAPPAEQRADQ